MSLRLLRAQVTTYRCVVDSGWFEVEDHKTALVGPNEAGKTAILTAVAALSPAHERKFNPVREFPRHLYHRYGSSEFPPDKTPIVRGTFSIDDVTRDRLTGIDPHFAAAKEVTVTRYWSWERTFGLDCGFPSSPTWAHIRGTIAKVAARLSGEETAGLRETAKGWAGQFDGDTLLSKDVRAEVIPWLDQVEAVLGADSTESIRGTLQQGAEELQKVRGLFEWRNPTKEAIEVLDSALPKFVYYDNYWRAHGRLHLQALKQRLKSGQTEQFDFANRCLLDYLRLSIDDLIGLGQVADKPVDQKEGQLDERFVRLSAAGIDITKAIREAWGNEVYRIRFDVDGDYLRALAVDESGVELEISEKSLGYQWFFSFYTVFYSQARDNLSGALLLLDEPGIHLHGLKQLRFREVLSHLSKTNQLLYTTHSPFLVGPDELQMARVVEIPEGETFGTTVSDITIAPHNPASLFPLQHALGYALSQSLFAQKRNLCIEGPTDLWYLQALKTLSDEADAKHLPFDVAFVPAGGAQRVTVFATILNAQDFKVATLFDSDPEGVSAATLDSLVKLLPKKNILQVGDFLSKQVKGATTEDLLRDTLLRIAEQDLSIAIVDALRGQLGRPVLSILDEASKSAPGTKSRLAKAFLNWAKSHSWKDLTKEEQVQVAALFQAVSKALK